MNIHTAGGIRLFVRDSSDGIKRETHGKAVGRKEGSHRFLKFLKFKKSWHCTCLITWKSMLAKVASGDQKQTNKQTNELNNKSYVTETDKKSWGLYPR
jgi:hypothetical protein